MLTAEINSRLTCVSAGTPMGDYLRRYWMPIDGADNFGVNPVRAIRLLGEDLVLYKGNSGVYGLIDRYCPHRQTDLSIGMVEEFGIRCSYHGWLFDEHGKCLEQPFDDIVNPGSRNREKCFTKAYPVRELAGLLWAYMGPLPAPELPNWEPFNWTNCFREIVTSEIPCNWFQCQENSIDPVHFEWTHENWVAHLGHKEKSLAAKHLKLKFEEFDYGFVYKRVREGSDETSPDWNVGRVTLWPNGFFLGNHFEWRVPIDDENTLNISWFFMRVPREQEPYVQQNVPAWKSPIKDSSGNWISSHIINQDFMMWVGQGTISDRTKEHLGASDVGISMMRNRFLEELEAVKRNEEPKAIIRDAELAKCVVLPNVNRQVNVSGITLAEYAKYPLLQARLKSFRHCFGQPVEVRRAFEQAMGLQDYNNA